MKQNNYKKVHDYILGILPKLKHEKQSKFIRPFLSVTYGQHYNSVFCWDNHHMSLRYAAEGEPEQMKYFVENMLHFQNTNGFIPSIINVDNGASNSSSNFHAQPFIAQNTAIYLNQTDDIDFLKKVYKSIQLYLDYWLENQSAPFGLYKWRETYMSGFDNEIAGTVFLPDTIISPDLNAWLYLELKSMSFMAKKMQDTAASKEYESKSKKLKEAINTYLWDEKYSTYAAFDLTVSKTRVGWADGTLNSDVGKYAYLSCSSLIPLYAGIADQKKADLMIKKYVINQAHFRSPYGIRSLSRSSEYYNNARWGNPPRFGDHRRLTNSNWQGPVWIPLNWFVLHALLYYGFHDEAEKLMKDTFKVISKSLDKLGFMRENFHGETGEPLYADYFASWNILADLMPNYVYDKKEKIDLFL